MTLVVKTKKICNNNNIIVDLQIKRSRRLRTCLAEVHGEMPRVFFVIIFLFGVVLLFIDFFFHIKFILMILCVRDYLGFWF